MFKDIFNLIVRAWRVLVFKFRPRCGACKNKLDKTNYWVPFRRGKTNIGLFACSGVCCAKLSGLSFSHFHHLLQMVKNQIFNDYNRDVKLLKDEDLSRYNKLNAMLTSLGKEYKDFYKSKKWGIEII